MSEQPLSDDRWMGVALAAADQMVGQTAENPSVGCALISKDNKLIAVGHTASGGRPHAEVAALAMLKAQDDMNGTSTVEGGTAYVTLEPCAHFGKTGPCAQALIDAKIARVVIACHDPDARVDGKGVAMLDAAGVVVSHLPHPRANRQIAGFVSRITRQRPFVSVKMATSHDGFITAKQDTQTWLTGGVSRAFVHDRRSRHDMMLTTARTLITDKAQMNVRIAGFTGTQPPLAILDSHATLPVDAPCLAPDRPVYLFCRKGQRQAAWPAHVTCFEVPDEGGGLCLSTIFAKLTELGAGAVMVEAGAGLFDSLHQQDLIDELVWLCAPHKLKDGLKAWHSGDEIDFCPPKHYIKHSAFPLGQDRAFIYKRT